MTKQQQSWRDWYSKKIAENPNFNRERYQQRNLRNPHHARDQSRKWLANHPDYARERGLKFRLEHPEKKKENDRKHYQKHTSKIKARIKSWKKYNPEKTRAHWSIANAKRDGRLSIKVCEVCGVTKVDCHHDNYSEPLNVRYLCRLHHRGFHAQKLTEKSRATV